MNDEIGKRYGRLVVVEDTGKKYHSTRIYKCLCDCGNYKEVNINKLHTGHVISCGCANHKIRDITGQKFGRLTVISYVGRVNNKSMWHCKCDCGNECNTYLTLLTTGAKTSCGCKNEENKRNIVNLDRGLVDDTCICGIKEDRKINKNNTSGVRGVHYDSSRKRWIAQITFQRKNYQLGRYKIKEDAIKARKEAELIYFGKYR